MNAKTEKRVILIDSLKHPEEVKILEFVYGNMFYLFGILCPEHIRIKRLTKNKKMDKQNAVDLIIHDMHEEEEYGQQLVKTLHQSDFFIRNMEESLSSLDRPIKRYIKLIFGVQEHTPTKDEFAMFVAQSSAYRSGCLSKQVGASIVSKDGDIISTGCNDVPKTGGGLYNEDDANDFRCMRLADRGCYNSKQKDIIFNKINDILTTYNLDNQEQILHDIKAYTPLKNIIKYSRAIHAEMDALLSALRNGSNNIIGSILYCTTYPCHNCARHLITAGIKKIYYIEPYEKSLACELHDDSISLDHRDKEKVLIIPFEGVAPKQYMRLFVAKERKEKESKTDNVCKPIKPEKMHSFLIYEAVIAKLFNEVFVEKNILHNDK